MISILKCHSNILHATFTVATFGMVSVVTIVRFTIFKERVFVIFALCGTHAEVCAPHVL